MRPSPPGNILDIFRNAADSDVSISFVDAEAGGRLSWKDIWQNARIIAASLQKKCIAEGDVVMIALPTSREFVETYVATVICGALPFVVSRVTGAADKAVALERLKYLCQQTSAALLITDEIEIETIFAASAVGLQTRTLTYTDLINAADGGCKIVQRSWLDAAIVQTSSGSTGKPTCLLLSNKNLVTNLRQLASALQVNHNDKVVSWLPLFHDMGLIGCFMLPVFCLIPTYLMKPMTFLRRPLRLLYEITEHAGTISPSPNFAYNRLIAQVARADKERLDLRSWRIAGCGSEPINPSTMHDFVRSYTRYGLSDLAFTPGYGMSEATLCVSSMPVNEPPKTKVHRIGKKIKPNCNRDQWRTEDRYIEVVNCGLPVDGLVLDIVDEHGHSLPENESGRILIDGESVFDAQYVDGKKIVRETGLYDTGDIGFLADGYLYLTGRNKDIIIINGKNYTSYFFEHVAEGYSSHLTGRTLAFGLVDNNVSGAAQEEKLHLLVETPHGVELRPQAIEAYVAKKTSIKPRVTLVAKNSLPRTTSGKLQRQIARKRFKQDQDELFATTL